MYSFVANLQALCVCCFHKMTTKYLKVILLYLASYLLGDVMSSYVNVTVKSDESTMVKISFGVEDFKNFYNYMCPASRFKSAIAHYEANGRRSSGKRVVNVKYSGLVTEEILTNYHTCTNILKSDTFTCSRHQLKDENTLDNYVSSECLYLRGGDCPCVHIQWKHKDERFVNATNQNLVQQCKSGCEETGQTTTGPTVKRASTTQTSTEGPDTTDENVDNLTPVIAAVVVSVVAMVLILAVVVLFVIRRRRFQGRQSETLSRYFKTDLSSDSNIDHDTHPATATNVPGSDNTIDQAVHLKCPNSGNVCHKSNAHVTKPVFSGGYISDSDVQDTHGSNKEINKHGAYFIMAATNLGVSNEKQTINQTPDSHMYTEIYKQESESYSLHDQISIGVSISDKMAGYETTINPENDYGYSGIDNCPTVESNSSLTQNNALAIAGGYDENEYEYVGMEHPDTSGKVWLQNEDRDTSADAYATVGGLNGPGAAETKSQSCNVYSRLREEVRDIKNPYDILPQP